MKHSINYFLFKAQPGVPTAPLEIRVVGPSAIMVEWGKPETDGGAPILSYVIAARDVRRTMWMEVYFYTSIFTSIIDFKFFFYQILFKLKGRSRKR